MGTWNPMNLMSQVEGDRLDLGANHTSILYVALILGGHFSMAIFCKVCQRWQKIDKSWLHSNSRDMCFWWARNDLPMLWNKTAMDVLHGHGDCFRNNVPFISINLITWYVELDTFTYSFCSLAPVESLSVLLLLSSMSSITIIYHPSFLSIISAVSIIIIHHLITTIPFHLWLSHITSHCHRVEVAVVIGISSFISIPPVQAPLRQISKVPGGTGWPGFLCSRLDKFFDHSLRQFVWIPKKLV